MVDCINGSRSEPGCQLADASLMSGIRALTLSSEEWSSILAHGSGYNAGTYPMAAWSMSCRMQCELCCPFFRRCFASAFLMQHDIFSYELPLSSPTGRSIAFRIPGTTVWTFTCNGILCLIRLLLIRQQSFQIPSHLVYPVS